MSQYKLYTGKAANSEGEAMSWLNQKLGDGTLGDDVKRNLLDAAKASQTQYQGAIGKAENDFRGTFEHDQRVESNPRASASYKANHMQFKSFPGGEGIGTTGAPATRGESAGVATGAAAADAAKQWLDAHPNDPLADGVRKKLKAMGAL
jgi:hypothetical protein